MNFIIKKNYEL